MNLPRITEALSLALHAVAFLARNRTMLVSTREMAQTLEASQAHLSKVLMRLEKAGFIESVRGARGGYRLLIEPEHISLMDIYEVIEGPFTSRACLLDHPICEGKGLYIQRYTERNPQPVQGVSYGNKAFRSRLCERRRRIMKTVRNIVRIDEEKCNGCGECVTACHEGAIQIIDGKARLVSETYCDGLGACLGECPQDAITIEQREAEVFDPDAVERHLAEEKQQRKSKSLACGCPGTMVRTIKKEEPEKSETPAKAEIPSELSNWPIQLKLVPPTAPYLRDADIMLVADCAGFAATNLHQRFLRGRPVLIGCPKLDDAEYYVEKLAGIIQAASPRSLHVVHMEVPCCHGIVQIARLAVEKSGVNLPLKRTQIGIGGEVQCEEDISPVTQRN